MLMELELLQLLVPDLPSNKQVNLTWSSITLGHKMSVPGGVHLTQRSTWPKGLTKCYLTWSSIMLGHKMSVPGGYIWPKVNLTQMSTWPQSSNRLGHKMPLPGVHLTKGQPDWSNNTLGHKMSLPGGGSVLTFC